MTGPKTHGPSPDSGRPKRAPPTIDLEATECPARPGRRMATPAAGASIAEPPSAAPASRADFDAGFALGHRAGFRRRRRRAGDRRRLDAGLARGAAASRRRRRRSMPPRSTISPRGSPASSPRPASRRRVRSGGRRAHRGAGKIARRAARRTRGRARAVGEARGCRQRCEVGAARWRAPAPDLSAINERIAQIERATRAQAAEIAQEGAKIADSKPADDAPLRRVVAASLLDVSVRQGDPFAAALAAAKSLADECRRAEAA